MTGKILLFVGPSGSGKTTAITSLVHSMPETFAYIPSLTTRPRRDDDVDWHYYFVSEDEFRITPKVQQTLYNGNYYGTAEEDLAKALLDNKIPTLAVTEDGVQHFIDRGLHPVVLCLDPYNFTPREGREAADAARTPLPTSGFSFSPIVFDWSLPPHRRKAAMLHALYDRITLLF